MNELKKTHENFSPNGLEPPIRINGKQQVIDMLRYADPQFREQILRGLEKRDPRLARELRLLCYS